MLLDVSLFRFRVLASLRNPDASVACEMEGSLLEDSLYVKAIWTEPALRRSGLARRLLVNLKERLSAKQIVPVGLLPGGTRFWSMLASDGLATPVLDRKAFDALLHPDLQ